MRKLNDKNDVARREGRGPTLFIGGMLIGSVTMYLVFTLLML
jgi:hypothetical protein